MGKNFVSIGCIENDERYAIQEKIDNLVEVTVKAWLKECGYTSFSDVINPGSRIVIKPNFVAEENFLVNEKHYNSEIYNECFITNKTIIKALVRLLNNIPDLKIKIIESPIQFCKIEEIVTPQFLQELQNICPLSTISFVDLRRTIYYKTEKEPVVKVGLREKNQYVDVDLGEQSEHTFSGKDINLFRVTDYPPSAMKEFHYGRHHIYRVAKEVFEADYIFNIPKLKTHMKAGMTGAEKNFIGVIGNKECLPHHTKGSEHRGGDCYGDNSLLKRWAENIMDNANQYIVLDKKRYWRRRRLAKVLLEIKWILDGENDIGGSWYGNDTIWRTIVDINRIIYYSTIFGELKTEKQRTIFTLIDAIVSGQNEGPMSPEPYYTGKIIFSDSTMAADVVAATILGFDDNKIKYLDRKLNKCFPLMEEDEVRILCAQKEMSLEDLKKLITTSAQPSARWSGHIERGDLINNEKVFMYHKRMNNDQKKILERIGFEIKRLINKL